MEGDVLVIRVPLDKKALAAAAPPATGKTKLVASSHGAIAVGWRVARLTSWGRTSSNTKVGR